MLTEMDANHERVTAVITSHLESGENYDGALVIGIYPDNNAEIWMLSQGTRIAIQVDDVDTLCKQIKRAKKLAQEQPIES